MPRVKLTKNAINSLPISATDTIYWDAACPGFGVKVTPKGRKVFVVLYRTGGAGSSLRKYTIGVFGVSPFIRPVWLRRGSSQRNSKGATPQLRNGQRSEESWPIASMNWLEAFIAQHVSQIAQPLRSLAFCAGRSAKSGVTRASMKSASGMLLNSFLRSSNVARRSQPTRP